MFVKNLLPGLDTLLSYDRSNLKDDIASGLTVGVMLIPQGMAYAMIAGLEPIYGLYAATIPILLYAFFGTSRQLAVGPVAMVSLLTASGVAVLAEAGSEAYLGYVLLLAFMVGLIQFLMGVFRLGFLVNFLSHPVISGFTSAAAIIIGASQLKHLLGIPLPKSHYVHEIFLAVAQQIGSIHWVTFALGLSGIGTIWLLKKVSRSIPGQIIAVIVSILVVAIFGLQHQGVAIVGEIPKGLPSFHLPMFSIESMSILLPIALAISLVSYMESIAVAKAMQTRHKDYKLSANQELIALGIANMGGSFFQSYPVTGGFSRTAVNDQAGAKTTLASIISAILVLLTLLFLTGLFYMMPNAILAAVIIVAVFGLIDVKEAVHLWNTHRIDFWMLIATFAATLMLGIEKGILIGVALSLIMVIFQSSYPHHAELGQVPGTNFYRNIDRFPEVITRPDLLVVRFDASLFFGNIERFNDALNEYIDQKGKQLRTIIINCESINTIDSTALSTLEEMLQDAEKADLLLLFSSVKGPIRDRLLMSPIIRDHSSNHFFMSIQDAVAYNDVGRTDDGFPRPHRAYTLQTNTTVSKP
ncbi:MAG: solute carrier family 26 protein [Saprospiraceae bacterium]|nr:solute carrier family 26 protein [Saprospiraceae bacterium]